MMQKLPVPPFTEETARQKVQTSIDIWNSRDPESVALAYTADSEWNNRDEFLSGRDAIRAFLKRKWQKELHYRLIKELWSFTDNTISVHFEYEWQHAITGQWYRTNGDANCDFDEDGYVQHHNINADDTKITADERRINTLVL
jgi:nuclear transport factor 2 (NTF2) superfamily protein